MKDVEKNSNREDVIDIARVVACVSVMLFHFYSRHLDGITQYPYGDNYNYFSYGYLGVEFFLMLSGFLLIPSLLRSTTFVQFCRKKLIRLWIPLLVCSAITYVFVLVADADFIFPDAHPFKNFLFSLTFINPNEINIFLPKPLGYINGSYWFLNIEILFLILSSLIFYIDKKNGLRNIIIVAFVCQVLYLFLFYCGHRIISNYFCNNKLGIPFSSDTMLLFRECLNTFVFPQFSIYCICGIVFYLIAETGLTKKNILALLSVIVLYVIQTRLQEPQHPFEPMIVSGIFLLFLACILVKRYGSAHTHTHTHTHTHKARTFLAAIGRTTYSAYLIHETIGVIIIHQYAAAFGKGEWTLPLILIIAALAYGYICYHYIEKPITKILSK